MHDVVVIGAGPSGLVAATDLAAAGRDVVVLEARDRVGGRTHTIQLGGHTVDVGGQWVGPDQHQVRALLRTQGRTTSPTPVRGRNVLVMTAGKQTYTGTIPRLPLLQLLQLQRSLGHLDALAERVHPRIVASPLEQAAADRSVMDLCRERGIRPEVIDLVRTSMRVVFGAELEDVSLGAMLQYLRQAGGIMPLVDTAAGAQDARVVGGMQPVFQQLADDLGDRVVLDAEVTAVRASDGGVEVVSTAGARRARQVVVAAPPNISRTWDWDDLLTATRRTWLEGHVMGRTRKVQARYARPFWRDAGLSGEAVWTHGPVSVVFDDTRPMGGAGLVGFVVGEPAHRVATLSVDARRALILEHLVEAFGEQARTPTAYLEQEWHDEPFSGGCPVATPSPGGMVVGFDPVRPDGPVLWAGTETARAWRGYVDGAIEAGHRAATQAMTRARPVVASR